MTLAFPRRHDISDEDKEDPMNRIKTVDLKKYVHHLWKEQFLNTSVTFDELWIGARLAKKINSHVPPPPEEPREVTEDKEFLEPTVTAAKGDSEALKVDEEEYGRSSFASVADIDLLSRRDWVQFHNAVKIQESKKVWNEPTALLVTIITCAVAPLAQGWNQVANGNLGWPTTFGLVLNPDGTGKDIWILGGANSIIWFCAATIGSIVIDPICHSSVFGRRGAVAIAAAFSCAAVIGSSQAKSWQGYLISRLFLGIGIGAKAAIVPIWESEVLPKAKRGRLLVLWQVFTATGIFAGSIATYIFKRNWRNQVLTGALPAFVLLILTYLCCESPRWLILQGRYYEAFETLIKLRKDRFIALEELCFIHFQVMTEKSFILDQKLDYMALDAKVHYQSRVWKILTFARNRRAAIATLVVMISQQLSGINILAFLASIFFISAGLRSQPDPSNHAAVEAANIKNGYDSLRFSIGFGAANALFSLIAYFLIERKADEALEDPNPVDTAGEGVEAKDMAAKDLEANRNLPKKAKKSIDPPPWMRGRRSLLLLSLAGGTVMLLILTFLLKLDSGNSAKLPVVMVFIMLFTFFYSFGAGAVPFVYSAEVWPNEGREIGMSWAVFWNFIGAGFLALFVPRGLQWGSDKLFGTFTGLSFLGFVLVYFFVPSVGPSMTLDEVSMKFEEPRTMRWYFMHKTEGLMWWRKAAVNPAPSSLVIMVDETDNKSVSANEEGPRQSTEPTATAQNDGEEIQHA
ncbi:major facilitator superfamily domain-containing protein [Phaeosphaeriaceae sp. PMI808]|nr:major facilitator superfamily domain-containing protein [Phaeosphaeriaceae sp. PMI808]